MNDIEQATYLLQSADDWYDRHGFDSSLTVNAHLRTTKALEMIADEVNDE